MNDLFVLTPLAQEAAGQLGAELALFVLHLISVQLTTGCLASGRV